MKRRMIGSLIVAAAVASGCASSKKQDQNAATPPQYPGMNQAAADAPSAPVLAAPPATYTPPPQQVTYAAPVSDQPVIPDGLADASEPYVAAPAVQHASGTRYTVRKGDSLWSIAQTRYGNGNRWKTIAAANPSIDPNRIQAGQTIVLP